MSPGGLTESEVDAAIRAAAACGKSPQGQSACSLDIGRVVHQNESLQRRVGHRTARHAFLPVGCIESRKGCRRHCSLPERIHAAPVEILTVVLNVGLHRESVSESQFLPQTRRLVGQHAPSSDLRHEQAAHGERVITNQFSLQPKARPARKQPVFRVFLDHCTSRPGRLPVCG